MLCDGFHAAEVLRRDHPNYYQVINDDDGDYDDDYDDDPHYYQLLADTVASFRDVGSDYIQYDKITQKPFLM